MIVNKCNSYVAYKIMWNRLCILTVIKNLRKFIKSSFFGQTTSWLKI